MGQNLKDKVAIVTGAGRGIGKGIAVLMAEEGAKVVVNDLGGGVDGGGGEKSPADEVVTEIKAKGGTAVANYDSVATFEGGENIIKTAIDSFGKLDILVNNAGILRDRMVFNMTFAEWDDVIRVHLYGTFNCTRHACPIMRNQKSGRIINFASESGLGNLGQANYSAAKEGIVGFTRTVARDMGKYGVTCNAIRPRAGTRMTLTDELRQARERKQAAGISGPAGMLDITSLQPEDVAPFVAYLATDEAANINGYDFMVGGGMVSLLSQPVITRAMHKEGRWTVEEVSVLAPPLITRSLVNPVPPAPPK
ncbi:MAG: SDR family oxidoreductase [Thermodesulfobacteriota bacterium]|nr:SDR family oxidoreductase [Thermodesulfobacteriota bacterium]